MGSSDRSGCCVMVSQLQNAPEIAPRDGESPKSNQISMKPKSLYHPLRLMDPLSKKPQRNKVTTSRDIVII